MKQTIGILGGKGMLGSDLARVLSEGEGASDGAGSAGNGAGGGEGERGARYETHAIDKDNYDAYRGKKFDVFINANGNSRRFWANEHPYEDFEASTASVYKSIADFQFGAYIYISSSDVYADHASPATTREDQPLEFEKLEPYGFHKALSEIIVRTRAPRWLILRSSFIIGSVLKKGPLYDMLNGVPLFITAESRLQAISTAAIARAIDALIRSDRRNEVFNMGGEGTFCFEEVADAAQFRADAQTQTYEMNVEKLGAVVRLAHSAEYAREFLRQHGIKKEEYKKEESKEIRD